MSNKQLIGKAALTYVRTDTGSVALVYAGRPCPSNILPSERERLVPNFLEEVDVEETALGVELGTGIEAHGWSGDPVEGAVDPQAITFDPDNPEGPFVAPDGTAAGTRALAAQGSSSGDVGDVSEDNPNGGTISQVKAWVGDDADRARSALEAEKEADSPRKTLVEDLEAQVAAAEDAEEDDDSDDGSSTPTTGGAGDAGSTPTPAPAPTVVSPPTIGSGGTTGSSSGGS